MTYLIRPVRVEDQDWIVRLTEEQWHARFVVAHDTVYYPEHLPGFVAVQDGERVGLITYRLEEDACEIVTLNSLRPGQGIGTALIEAVRKVAQESGSLRLWLVTSNDNLDGLHFYRERGFRVAAVHPGAIDAARKIKPSIPLIGDHGIPIHDEIELEIVFCQA